MLASINKPHPNQYNYIAWNNFMIIYNPTVGYMKKHYILQMSDILRIKNGHCSSWPIIKSDQVTHLASWQICSIATPFFLNSFVKNTMGHGWGMAWAVWRWDSLELLQFLVQASHTQCSFFSNHFCHQWKEQNVWHLDREFEASVPDHLST